VRRGPLEAGEAVGLVEQVAAGLEEAHGKGIIHRDIKSANVMVMPTGRAKVMDFGLAKLQGETSLTRRGTTLGTVAYMSPEQARGEALDPRTDIWSLGVVLYELLTGELPFKGDHDQAVIHSILHDAPTPPSKVRPGLPAALDAIVLKALVKQAGHRYQRMEEVRGDLAAVAAGRRPLEARLPGTFLGTRTTPIHAALVLILALALVLGLDVGGLRRRFFGGEGDAERVVKLAVLPFANLTGDPKQEYLSDGLTQELITLLGRLHPQSLSVIARTSVMRYKKPGTPIDQIGRELNVHYVLEGSVRREGSRIRISADLIQVRDQTWVWGAPFEREMAGILALQNDVAREVAKALALELLPSEQAALAKGRPVNPEAYEACLRGSFHLQKIAPEDLDIAEKYFDLALERDPAYAPAYAGRAGVWGMRSSLGFASREEAEPKARAALLRVIELDGDSAAAHLALAELKGSEWDWDGALESIQKALELDPNSPDAQGARGASLMIRGHLEEAHVHFERALALDPFNPLGHGWYAFSLHQQRRYDEAIAAARRAQRFKEDHILVLYVLQAAHHMKGLEKEAIRALMAGYRVATGDNPKIHAAFDECSSRAKYAEGMRCVAEALAVIPEANALPVDIAMTYAMAGDKEKALEWLEKGLEARNYGMLFIGVDPVWDDLRPDSRFQALLRKMKLPTGDKQ
jgi:TolB-like protein/Tfp pilus assembly protein PilF